MKLQEPTGDQCNNHDIIFEDDYRIAHAIWYPQMGGYAGKAIAVMFKEPDSCVDVFVWHDGDFPFCEGDPREIHHCDPEQFIRFGETLRALPKRWQEVLDGR